MRIKKLIKSTFVLFSLISILFILTSCAGTGVIPAPSEEISYVKLDVTCIPQGSENWCVAACATMVFNYYGLNISLSEVANGIGYTETSASYYDLVDYAEELGFKTKMKWLTVDEVKYYLQNEIPVIRDWTHANLIIGYDDAEGKFISLDSRGICYEGSFKYSVWGHYHSNEVWYGIAEPTVVIYE